MYNQHRFSDKRKVKSLDELASLSGEELREIDWFDVREKFDDSTESQEVKFSRNLGVFEKLIGCLEEDWKHYTGTLDMQKDGTLEKHLNTQEGFVCTLLMLKSDPDLLGEECTSIKKMLDVANEFGGRFFKRDIKPLKDLHNKLADIEAFSSLASKFDPHPAVNLARTNCTPLRTQGKDAKEL